MSQVAHTCLYAMTSAVAHGVATPYQGIQVAHEAHIGYGSRVAHEVLYSLNVVEQLSHEVLYDLLQNGRVAHEAVYDMPSRDRSRVQHKARWSLW